MAPATDEERCASARRALDRIVDPCSATAGTPIGLAEMGILEITSCVGGRVDIVVRPTFPGCLFVATFEDEARRVLADLPWVTEVTLTAGSAEDTWTEDRIAGPARRRLEERRQLLRTGITPRGRRAEAEEGA